MLNPANVTVTYPSKIIAGSSVKINCTVTIRREVDIVYDVFILWTGPDINLTKTSKSFHAVKNTINDNTYTTTVTIDAARNGTYTCQAIVNSSSMFITGVGMLNGSADITVG